MVSGVRTEIQAKKERTALLSVGTAVSLSLLKVAVFFWTGSMGILSSAVDNLGDIAMSLVNFFSIRKSSAPPDRRHPYGHGKVEALAAAFQGFVIAGTGIWIVFESVRRFLQGKPIEAPEAGVGVMTLSIVVSYFLSRHIERVGKETDSSALVSDSLHFRTDVLSGAGILLALLLVRLTGNPVFDYGTGVVVGLLIVKSTIPLFQGVLDDLLDRELPREVRERIDAIIDRHRPMVVDVHAMRTRKAGSMKHIDFHVVVCKKANVEEAHKLAEHLEMEIEEDLGQAHVVTHIDPCDGECPVEGECERLLERMRNLRTPGKDRDREKYYFED
ncbi:MAG: cation transporter [Deltaproteobacteria bacterium]|nr:MAG: cation transporter [Deltaproteobacteria bacterium]